MNASDKSPTDNHTAAPVPSALAELILKAASERVRPDGSPYRGLLFRDELRIAQETEHSQLEVQLAALSCQVVPERYARNQHSLSCEEQIRLLRSHVAVIGLGGLGGAVTEILARIGIGRLTLVDGDHFDDSNLNRQLLSSVDLLGTLKATAAAERVNQVNPAIQLRIFPEFLTKENSDAILAGVDIGVDCLDTIPARFFLEAGCRKAAIPLVSAAIGGTSGQITVIFPEDPGLRLIYGEPESCSTKGVETRLGTLPFTATAMAALECAEVVSLAAGRPSKLRRKLLFADFSHHTMDTVDFT